jgi:AraC-like DNA-binding protein
VTWTVVHGGCRQVQPEEFTQVWQGTVYWSLWWADQPMILDPGAGGPPWTIPSEHLVLVPPRLSLRRRCESTLVQFYLTLRLDPPAGLDRPHLHAIGEVEAALLRRLIRWQIGRGEPQAAEAVATDALVSLVLAGLPEEVWQVEVTDARIRAAIVRLRQDPTASLAIADLAAEARLSEGHFLRLFHAQTGTSPQRLRLDWRLDLAADALRAGATIKAAARSAGWTERTRFSTTFRRRFGLPPAAWLRAQER